MKEQNTILALSMFSKEENSIFFEIVDLVWFSVFVANALDDEKRRNEMEKD